MQIQSIFFAPHFALHMQYMKQEMKCFASFDWVSNILEHLLTSQFEMKGPQHILKKKKKKQGLQACYLHNSGLPEPCLMVSIRDQNFHLQSQNTKANTTLLILDESSMFIQADAYKMDWFPDNQRVKRSMSC